MEASFCLRRQSITEFSVDAFVVFFGVWMLVHELAYFSGLSFHQNWLLALVCSCLAVVSFFCLVRTRAGHYPVRYDAWLLWLALIMGVVFTVCLYRPDADDGQYLGLAVLSLDFPDSPIKSLPTVSSKAYAITCYDFFRAAVSYFSQLPVLDIFYLYIPALVSMCVLVFQYRLYKLLGVNNIALAFIVFFVVMLAWGDVHRSPANLGFVKFFQGKGPLEWLTIPAILFYWLRFHVTQEKVYLILILCAALGGIGFSATGIPVAFLLMLMMSVSSVLLNKELLRDRRLILFVGVCVSAMVVAALVLIFVFHHKSTGIHTSQGTRALNSFTDYLANPEMIRFVLGNSLRAGLALCSLVLMPFILPDSAYRKPMSTYVAACIVLLVFPFTSAILGGYVNETLAWRWLFVIPFVLSIVVLVDRVYSRVHLYYKKLSFVLPVLILCSFYWASYPMISGYNHTTFERPKPKVVDPGSIPLLSYGSPPRLAHTEGRYIVSPVTGKKL